MPRLRLAVLILILSTVPAEAAAQSPARTVMVKPARQYPASSVQRFLLGEGYRELWDLEIEVEVLDLEQYGGGLTPLERGGGQQTQSLRFQGGDGLVYNFRSVDKNARQGVDPILRGSLAADILQDQISSLFPLSAMVVSPLLDAVGLYHPQPELRVMPDDPALGPFREEFAGVLGWIELRPDEGEDDTAGFAGSERVVGSPTLFDRLEEEPNDFVDARAFLKARYLDFLVGDWDRHPDQWRWAGFPEVVAGRNSTVFQPVPRDRDWALARIDGVVGFAAGLAYPQYVGFSRDFPAPREASWNGRGLDRRLLTGLTREDYIEVAEEIVAQLSDSIIRDAVERLPESYLRLEGEELLRNLLHRRRTLPAFAEEYFALHANTPDVDATDQAEYFLIERLGDADTRVVIYDLQDDVPRPEPYFERTFRGEETEELRLYLHGGDDWVLVRGDANDVIELHIVGGGGDDTFVDQTTGRRVHFHDHRGDNRFEPSVHTQIDTRDYDPPEDGEAELHGARPLDWGHLVLPVPGVSFAQDEGLVLTMGIEWTSFGFRRHPWASRTTATAGIATGTGKPSFELRYQSRYSIQGLVADTRIFFDGARFDRFYGFGNETLAPGDDDLFEAETEEVGVESALVREWPGGISLSASASYRHWSAQAGQETLVDQLRPYGYGDFQQLSVGTRVSLDRRDAVFRPRRGFQLEAAAIWTPQALDAESSYTRVSGVLHGYLPLPVPLNPVLAMRVRGEQIFGNYPYLAAASIGGSSSLRGLRNQRYTGDASLTVSSEIRAEIGEFLVLFPGELGVLGLVDHGRVFVDGETSDRWHRSIGGGIWISLVDAYSASLVVARGPEETGLYFRFGVPF